MTGQWLTASLMAATILHPFRFGAFETFLLARSRWTLVAALAATCCKQLEHFIGGTKAHQPSLQ